MYYKEYLIERIGYFRNKANLSARELSLRLGKSPTYINQIESKNFTLSVPMLFEILAVLELSCEEFFSEDYMHYKQNKEILNLLNNLPPERKSTFIDLMRNIKK